MPYVERGGNNKTTTSSASSSSSSPIVFLSGFPDNELSSWGEQVPASLEADGHRLVFMCLPGYETVSLGKGKPSMKRSWGYSLEEVLQIMHSTVLDLGVTASNPFVLIAHDWGAAFALMFCKIYPELVSKLVLCDIGIISFDLMSFSPVKMYYLCSYQVLFALSYIVSETVSQHLGQMLAVVSFIIVKLFCSPTPHDKLKVPPSEVTVDKFYPYYYLWKGILSKTLIEPAYPRCPVLFMYGTKKNVMFHDDSFITQLKKSDTNRVVSLDAGHWFMVEKPEATVQNIREFLR